MLAWDGFKARRKGRTPPTFGRRIIGVMEKNINSEKRVPTPAAYYLSVGMHKIDFFLFPDVSKYQKVMKIKGPYMGRDPFCTLHLFY